MNRIGGLKRKSRHKYTKGKREKGKIRVSRFMQRFEPGQRVHLSVEPSYHKGLYHSKFIGLTGTIKSTKGNCYEVTVNDSGKEKTIVIHPVHLRASG